MNTAETDFQSPPLEYCRNILCEALEQAHECILLTDPDGRILYMNRTYEQFLNLTKAVGRHVTEVIENTRMHIVAQTGKAEIASIQRIQGHDMIANRIPIVHDGKVVAVFGTVMFQDVRQLYALSATVDRLRKEVDFYKGELFRKVSDRLGASYSFSQIVGVSADLLKTKGLAERVSKGDTTVLITGESGTGKELFAHAIHANSPRAMGPFIRVNCAAIPEPLLESELFGYEGGAFTGASREGKKGKFELADRGTILLDEIGDMPLSLQAKLLRVLQEREIERVGGTHPVAVDVRVISSTHHNLRQLMADGRFREDLFYRLHVVAVHIPPLRERLEDLPILTHSILQRMAETTGIDVCVIDADVWGVLQGHDWPGNVRELQNVLERALYFMEGNTLRADHVSASLFEQPPHEGSVRTLKETVHESEKAAIVQALASANGDRRRAAALLGISRSSLYQKTAAYGIDV